MDYDRDTQEAGPDETLLPGFPMMTRSCDRSRSRRTEHRSKRGEQPVTVRRL